MVESQSYQNMLTEVESIVNEIGGDDIDLDQMVKKVERGYQLIQTMRKRLDSTKEMIDKLHEKYE